MCAFTLLETLLTIFIMAALLLFAVNYYKRTDKRTDRLFTKNDVNLIMNALTHYFQQNGCTKTGAFNHPLQPSFQQLELASQYQQQLPLIEKFQAQIKAIGKTKKDKTIYQLMVIAELNNKINATEQQALANALGASVLTKHIIVWTALPNSSITSLSHAFWLMQGSMRAFKQFMTNYNQAGDHYSYCIG